MSKEFGRTPEGQQRFPGRMIKAMAMFEVFYAQKFWYARKYVERYKENNYKYYDCLMMMWKKNDEMHYINLCFISSCSYLKLSS